MGLNGTLLHEAIYITLNSRPIPGEYHWGLIITNSNGKPILHHASKVSGQWAYNTREVNPAKSMSLIAIIHVAKVKSVSQADAIIQSIPAKGGASQRTGEAFTCRTWAKDVLVALSEHAVITLPSGIDIIESEAIKQGLEYAPEAESGKGATVVNDAFSGQSS